MAVTEQQPKSCSVNDTSSINETHESSTAEVSSENAQRILVAEDSPVTQDLLKLVLEERGHHVEVVADGEAALAELKVNTYDVVLMDFHLPKMDGLEVAFQFHADNTIEHRPRFVAITSDIKGLLSHSSNCENFDEVIPKPFELEDVLAAIEDDSKKKKNVSPPTHLPVPSTAASKPNKTGFLEAHDYQFLRWPDDFNADRLSARGLHASLGKGQFDAILLNEPASVRDLSVIWTTKTLHLLPVIDMTGSIPKQVDLDGSKISVEETDKLDNLIHSFRERRAELHDDLVYTDDIGEKLVGRIFVSGGSLEPGYDPSSRELTCYNTVLDFRSIDKEIKELLTHGFVSQNFFDRLHTCGRCGSSHFNIREECTECGSSNLEEESYLHHFKCAYQGPESDFRVDDDLVCPKCRQELTHFSVDYDKPGSMLQCQSCGHATSEPDIGFVCMECEAHYDGDTVRMRDVYAYELTSLGTDFAKAGRAILDDNNATLRFAELPLELIVSMNAELKKYKADKTPFSLLNISYRNEREVEHAEGVRMFEQSRALLLENLHNIVRKQDFVVKGHNYDFVLLKGTPTSEILAGLDELCAEATASLRVDLGLHIDVFGPEDFN